MPESAKKTFVIFTYFILILSTLLVFWQVRNFDFISYDDNDYVYENSYVLNGLTENSIVWAFKTCSFGYWQPLTWLSLMVNCQLFGTAPGSIHLVNVFLHIANTLLLFAVFKKMTGALWPSAFVAAAFAIHPMHVESVAWIAERKDVLSTLFLLLTLAAYLGYVRKPTIIRYALTICLFTLGLLAKPMLVTLPFLLLLLDYWPLNRLISQTASPPDSPAMHKQSFRRCLIEKIPFFVLSTASSVVTFLTQKAGDIIVDTKTIPLMSRIDNAFLSYIRYIGKLFWPQNLAVFYPFDDKSLSPWQAAMCILLLIVISILVIRFGRNRKYLPTGWFWFVGTLVPVIGLVQFTGSSYADRFTYIPYIGLFIMIAWGTPELLSKLPQRKIVHGLLIVIILTTLGICAHRQVSYWNNSFTLFSHAIDVTKNNYIAYNNRGAACNRLGRYQDAIEEYKQSIKIMPNYADAYFNLGIAYGELGDRQNEINAYKQTIKIRPAFLEAYINLGVAYNILGRYQDAIETYKQVIIIKPAYAEAHFNLGVVYGELGRWQNEIDAYKRAMKIKPDYIEAHYNLCAAYLAAGDKNAALEEYKILKTLGDEKADELFKLISK
jgi:protein O-mannosyl-transferase